MARLSPAFFYGSELEFLRAKYELFCGLVDVVAATVTIAIFHLLLLLVFRPITLENFAHNPEFFAMVIGVLVVSLLLIGVHLETHWLLLPYVGYLLVGAFSLIVPVVQALASSASEAGISGILRMVQMTNIVPICVLIAIHIACVFVVVQCSRYFREKKQLIRDNSGPLLRHTYSANDYGAMMTCESGSNAMHFH